jgi:hypothetical protein
MAIITNIIVKEVHDKVGGNQAKLHSALCKLMGKNPHPFLMFVEP